jgi:electron transport complex protein RnfG
MKETVKLVLVLTIICVASSALLAAVYQKTEAPIREALVRRSAKAAALVMPAGCGEPEMRHSHRFDYYVAKKDGKTAAVAIEGVSMNGYGGEVVLMVGLGMDGKLVSFEVVKANETPGLGAKMKSEEFKNPIKGHALASIWKVKKDGGDVDAITAATISSRAAMDCIRDAIAKFDTVKASL